MKALGKWIEGVEAQTPVAAAGAEAIRVRLRAVSRAMREAARSHDGEPGGPAAESVHQLRVAARRATATLRIFQQWADGKSWRKADQALRRLRRRAGKVRDGDVLIRLFTELRAGTQGPAGAALDMLIAHLHKERRAAAAALGEVTGSRMRRKLRRARRRLVRKIRRAANGASDLHSHSGRVPAGPPTMVYAAHLALPALLAAVRESLRGDLTRIEAVHTVRKTTRDLRYALEVLAPTLGQPVVEDVYPRLVALQNQLGDLNDSDAAASWLEAEAARRHRTGDDKQVPPIAALAQRYSALRDHRLARFLNAGGVREATEIVDRLSLAIQERPAPTPSIEPAAAHRTAENKNELAPPGPVRLAAIDVGSNSTRLVIAEAYPDGTYRLLDDERELTRLAHGLVQTGRLDPAVMARAVEVIARLRGIAEGHGCSRIRAVATAAVREATNGAEFVALVRERAGLDLKIIGAEEEAALAYLSVSRAFGDLRTLAAGVVDIGGGSTQVVLSQRGAVEAVATLPLGAVRLTEQFGGPEACAGKRFKEMREFIRATVRERIGEPPLRPELLVGTGGTQTTLAAIAMHREGAIPAGLAEATVQGYQLRDETVHEILDELREMSLEKRQRVPGLAPERADIVVAGLTVIEAVMRHLGATRLRIHERGVRDGVLIQMIREVFPAADAGPARRDRMGAARALAAICPSEQRHSEHVASLAVQIFDGLAPTLPMPDDLWSGPEARELLEAGALLHDIGYIVSYAKHHKHAYHLILHADVLREGVGGPGAFSRREVQIIACLARYHRRGEPSENDPELAGLMPEDRALLLRLAAILRLADGLDRTHSQNVRGIRVRIENGTAILTLDAADDPATDIWGASRKAGLFRRAFGLEPRFEWASPPTEAGRAPARAAAAG